MLTTPSSPTYVQANRPGCLVQLLWFALIGWWLGLIWTGIAWALMATYIGIPIGVMMINMIPDVMALRGRRVIDVNSGHMLRTEQINIVIRAIYFFALGWWLSGIWMTVAYICCATLILMPIGFKMFDLTPLVVSLRLD